MKKKFKLNQSLRGFSKGYILSLEVDKSGMPVDRYWHARAMDAAYDNCMEKFVEASNTVPKTEKKIDSKKKAKEEHK